MTTRDSLAELYARSRDDTDAYRGSDLDGFKAGWDALADLVMKELVITGPTLARDFFAMVVRLRKMMK